MWSLINWKWRTEWMLGVRKENNVFCECSVDCCHWNIYVVDHGCSIYNLQSTTTKIAIEIRFDGCSRCQMVTNNVCTSSEGEKKQGKIREKNITDFPTELNSGLNTKTYIAIHCKSCRTIRIKILEQCE